MEITGIAEPGAAMSRDRGEPRSAALELALEMVSGKWKARAIAALSERKLRFGELERRVPDASRKVLVQQLRSLEADGILVRTAYPEKPPRVEYALSERGRALLPILRSLEAWGAGVTATGAVGTAPEQPLCQVIPLSRISPG